MSGISSQTIFYQDFSIYLHGPHSVSKSDAVRIFAFFEDCKLFRWSDANNDCEDRANAICILLDHWSIPNYKGWVFSGSYLKKGPGCLVKSWNYHVAAALPVRENNLYQYYVIDPAVAHEPILINEWADKVTEAPFSYHFIRQGTDYIFPTGSINNYNWHERDSQNFKWTMQGLAGINGLSSAGKAYVTFNKKKVNKTTQLFNQLKAASPDVFKAVSIITDIASPVNDSVLNS